jgi:hypothetical protein
MREEHIFFTTSQDACSCAETAHLSSSDRIDIPSRHRHAMGAQKPRIPEGIALLVWPSTEKLEYSEAVHDRNSQVGHPEEVEGLKSYAIQQIKHFSHAWNKEVI